MFRKTRAVVWFVFSILSICHPEDVMGNEVIIRPSVSSKLRYDINAYFRGKNRSEKTEETIFELSPQLEAIKERKSYTLSGSYAIKGDYSVNKPKNSTIDQYVTADLKSLISDKTVLKLNDNFTYMSNLYESYIYDASLIGFRSKKTGFMSNNAAVSLSHDFTYRTTASVNSSYGIFRFKSPAAVDTNTFTSGAGLEFRATPYTSLTGSYNFTDFEFKSQSGKKNIDTHSLELGVKKQMANSLDISISGGTSYSPGPDSHYDLIANIWVTKTYQRASFKAGYSRRTSNTLGLTDKLNLSDNFSARINYQVTAASDLTLNGTYIKNRSTPVASVDINMYTAVLKASWRPYSWLTTSAGFAHLQQWVHGPIGDDYRKDQVFVELTAYAKERRY